MSRPVFHSIQVLRGLAALLVVLFHLRIVEGKYGQGPLLLGTPVGYAYNGVDLFFVLSGFVMTTIAAGSYGSPREAGRFLLRRGWRILPLYWLYTTLVLVLMLVAPGMANTSSHEQSVLASYLLWPQAGLPLLTVGWTLTHEAFFYLLMAVAIAFARARHLPWLLGGWAVATVLAHAWPPASSTPWAAVLSSPLSLEFIVGAFVGLYWRHLPAWLALPVMALGLAIFLGAMVWFAGPPAQDVPVLQRALWFGLTSSLLVLGAVRWEQQARPRFPRVLTLIGDSSFSLYLGHVFVISAAGRLWQYSGWTSAPWQHGVFVLVAVVASVIVGWVSWRLLELPLQRMARRREAGEVAATPTARAG
jgi:exopolysaccharide production protein ExoZ